VIAEIGRIESGGYDLIAELWTRHGLPGIALYEPGRTLELRREAAVGVLAQLAKPTTADALDRALATALARPRA
jgi:hypothetical protein